MGFGRGSFERESPDSLEYPQNDNGENFIFSLIALPFRVVAFPIKIVIGMVSAKVIDDELARRGYYEGEESDAVMDLLDEYEQRFKRRRSK